MKRKRGLAWQDGDERVQRAVDQWVREPDLVPCERVHRSARRTLFRLPMPQELEIGAFGEAVPRSLMIKVHHTRTGAHPERERWKAGIGWSPALREWLALVELHRIGIPVPAPLAWGRLPDRDPVVVTEYCPGRNLGEVLATASMPARADWIDRLADCIVEFHRSGFRHGDLHLGNLHAQGNRILVMDLQSARRARRRQERLRDLAQIDLSLARSGFEIELRERLRRRLESTRGLDPVARVFVQDFVRGRTRKNFRVGEDWLDFEADGLVGMRDRTISERSLRIVLAQAREDPRAQPRRGGRTQMSQLPVPGGHAVRNPLGPPLGLSAGQALAESVGSVVVKRLRNASALRALGERLFGSNARRAFRVGQQLSLLGMLCARPIAFLEDDRGAGPYSNWLFLEKVGQADLDRYQPESEARAHQCAAELMRWIAEWQRFGIEHRDLKGSNIRIDANGPNFRFWLVDLEDIRIQRRPLSDRTRFRALTQLGASLSDDAFSVAARRHGLEIYLKKLPFAKSGTQAWRRALVRETLARQHRWQGRDCSFSRSEEPTR